jgi:signal transduction histidine kinase
MSIWELRSQTAAQGDLASRLIKMADEVVARAGSHARTQMQVSGTYRPLEPAAEREVVRIAREAVTNAVRHGSPASILLRLVYDQRMFGMEIRDDGSGFTGTHPDGPTGHFGLTGMRERARAINGTLAVESREGQGTQVKLELPLGRETAGKA